MFGDEGIRRSLFYALIPAYPPIPLLLTTLQPSSRLQCSGGLDGLTGSECCATFDLSMQLLGQPTSRARFSPTSLNPKP